MPPLGCGQGQLEWDTVCPILTHYLRIDIPVEIYVPYEIPEIKIQLEPFNKEIKNKLLRRSSSELIVGEDKNINTRA